MSGPLQSRFRELVLSALQDYERETGIALIRHPLTERLKNCHSVESIVGALRAQAQGISDPQGDGNDRIMKSLEGTTSVLCMLSTGTILGKITGLVRHVTQMGVPCF